MWEIKNAATFLCILSGELVFSGDLCYNEANEKPPSEREGDRVSGGRSLRDLGVVVLTLL